MHACREMENCWCCFTKTDQILSFEFRNDKKVIIKFLGPYSRKSGRGEKKFPLEYSGFYT